jgi:predicted ATPase
VNFVTCIVPEVARKYFADQITKGRSVEEVRGDIKSVEKEILQMQLACEDELHCEKVVFLDRGLPDVLTFYRWEGLNPNLLLKHCFRYCYAAVYVLDPLPVVRDGIRIEGEN